MYYKYMDEISIINTITKIAGNEYIGDDCAFLPELGVVISQDSLVEDIHFKRKWCTPFQLGYKSAVVNISDILASGAVPKFITVALSLPETLPSEFVEQFYKGLSLALNDVKIIGGDITGSPERIVISITAIGVTNGRNISSRKYAKPGYLIITKGNFGSSAAGLKELQTNGSDSSLIKSHLEPVLDYNLSEKISTLVKEPYAMMDTSDGLADALFKIAEASNVSVISDYNTIPHLDSVNKNDVLFGGEDYNLIAAVPEKYIKFLENVSVIGKVTEYKGVRLNISGEKFNSYKELNVFNHFGGNNE